MEDPGKHGKRFAGDFSQAIIGRGENKFGRVDLSGGLYKFHPKSITGWRTSLVFRYPGRSRCAFDLVGLAGGRWYLV